MAEERSYRAADIEARAAEAAAKALAGGADLATAARAAIAVADAVMAELGREPAVAQALAGVACRAGCGWCCHQVVGITAAEEVLVEKAVMALPAAARARLKARQAQAWGKLAPLPVERWQAARVPCPLMEEGACIIHPDRPLPCRAVLSPDADVCRRWLEGADDVQVPLVAVQRRVYSLAQSGLAQALAQAGIPPGPVALVEALELM